MNAKTFAVTGATGFVGSQLVSELLADGHTVIHIGRSVPPHVSANLKWVQTDLQSEFDVTSALRGVDAIFHLAARAHVMNETSENPEVLYRQMNFEATRRLAEQAKVANVGRFVFLSSVKAVGESSTNGPWTAATEPNPLDFYGQTKLEAETALRAICENSPMTCAILRSPLVYGPGVRANFLSLIRAVNKNFPLPFGLTTNRRSIVAKANLTSALRACAVHPQAANKTFFVSDGSPLSTAELIRAIGAALGRNVNLLPVPIALLKLTGLVTGKSAQINRLVGNLEIDTTPLKKELDWKPPLTTADALRETAVWFKTLQSGS